MNRGVLSFETQAGPKLKPISSQIFGDPGLHKRQNKRMNDIVIPSDKPGLTNIFTTFSHMTRFLLLIILSAIILLSCSNRYKAFKSLYAFKNETGIPVYNDLNYWAAHPWKWDPSDSVPRPLRDEPVDSAVDVFFLHPTTYTMKKKSGKRNADINDSYLNAKTDYSAILSQASVFNQHCRIFAPRYRQAH